MITVSKDFTFDAAHRLVKGYEGKCKNVHGHTYKVELTATTPRSTINQYDFIMDFDHFKAVKKWVDDNWDHAMLVNMDDEEMIEFLKKNNQKYFEVHANPTVEILCAVLRTMAEPLLVGAQLVSITIWETPTSKAKWTNLELIQEQV